MNKFKLIQVAALMLFPVSGIAQRVEIYEDSGGVKYAAINTEGLPRRTEDRNTNDGFYVDVNLYTYSLDGKGSTPILDDDGNPIVVKRVKRHRTGEKNYSSSGDYNISKCFIISPTNVYNDGTTDSSNGGKVTMNWATANGYLATANNTSYSSSVSATPMGCSQYRGKSGTDDEGTWRVPTHKEGALIAIFYKELEDTSADTDFKSFKITTYTNYWLATEDGGFSSQAWSMTFTNKDQYGLSNSSSKTSAYYLRCIRDIAVE